MSVKSLLMLDGGNIQELLRQTEDYVVKSTQPVEEQADDDEEVNVEEESPPSPKQPPFRFLSKCRTTIALANPGQGPPTEVGV